MKIQKHKWKNYSKETSAAIEISDIFIRHELNAEYHRRLANRESKDYDKALSFSNLLKYSTDYNEIITRQLDHWKAHQKKSYSYYKEICTIMSCYNPKEYEYKCLIYGDRTNSDTGQRLCQICYKDKDKQSKEFRKKYSKKVG
tara:strand:+ start:359 stop:787 length:429 start_codon:yes stop_codon:yes gene_type:complete